ncbi:hypothetical protein BAUCODRAFT_144562 [Baudoinia panamericana UAMH 10762]|uniref:Carbonic anhydrase n=1 Tax=Baudoinia panamericana (strain UAMH 10762) TaxID=717646 RepID=M2M1P8_BAUPA|nr:uncharacterized protein BAUCODRAFT_144562 [Baudoinia panamericana UAMH 10762]EMD00978.1 hypothetical protein BAUCODRAFT_144562 [Baudoinia panamericana UAMH 10762]
MTTENQHELVTANARYASTFDEDKKKVMAPPRKKYILVTCMDARIDSAAAFGIALGDAHVIRNAGASVQEAFRSIMISQHFMGTLEVIIVKHTECGMSMFTNDEACSMVTRSRGLEALPQDYDFGCIVEAEQSARDDVAWLKQQRAVMEETEVSGWLYDVRTARVRKVA